MPVVNATHDTENLSLTITAEFAAPVERVWDVYADPRQLEKVFGPPTYPATFVEHKLAVGSQSKYYMTGPEGDQHHGLWTITSVDEPRHFEFEDAFADADFNALSDMPASRNTYSFEAIEGGTRATYVSAYSSAEDLQAVLDMGAVEGATLAINQIDDHLASG